MNEQKWVRPFLKWPGSKFDLLSVLEDELSILEGKHLMEPFCGSGVVSLNMGHRFEKCIAADANEDLVCLLRLAQKTPELLIKEGMEVYARGGKKDAFDATVVEYNQEVSVKRRAVLLLYLNRHCFNGLIRYNQKGIYNVPVGEFKQILAPWDLIRTFTENSQHIEFVHSTFEKLLSLAKPGDVVYSDPPYLPIDGKTSFTAYHKPFRLRHHVVLRDYHRELSLRGIPNAISNHDCKMSRHLYSTSKYLAFEVQRSIGSKTRGKAPECIAVFTKPALNTKQAMLT
ncbi:DNA adenine methylase [Enterovibrio norvegicus]|uniref:DNA adenine methylase n=1 Tax=Enterovibrio norvegicus TaxID=188144 RepID=UPI00352E18B5